VTETVPLILDGRPVAEYHWQPDLPATLSPRPYLHPVRTLGGVEVTELMPDDHKHHLGVSIAVADVAGHNFWGGRTFVRYHGSRLLPNHGTQRHVSWLTKAPDELVHEVLWCDPAGGDLLHERRRLAAVRLGADAWALDLSFTLTNVAGDPVAFASPATNGRAGAGYGGFFWRAPRGSRPFRAYGVGRGGEQGLHGAHSDWVALSSPQWTLVFVGGDVTSREDRWFVRVRDYPGIGSALAWDRPVVVDSRAELSRRIVTVIADGPMTAAQSASLAAQIQPTQ
jgi:hypothetical protein